jgi:hypothetical protein
VHFRYLDNENSGKQWKQRALLLFSRLPNRRRPRISAENAMSVADNFVQKQQKQQYNRNYRPADRFAHLVNASKH